MSNNRYVRRCKQKALQNCNKFYKKSDVSSLSWKVAQDCVICLDVVVCRGVLSVCDHWFCFECIFEWAKNTNTCPLCKLRFRCITKVSQVPGGSSKQTFRIKDKNQSNMAIAEDDYEVALGLVNEETSFDEDDHDADETFYPSSGEARLRRASSRNTFQLRRFNRNSHLRQAHLSSQSSSSLSSQTSPASTTTPSISAAINSPPSCVTKVSQTNSVIYSDTSEDEISQVQQANLKKRKKRSRIVYRSPKRKKNTFTSANNGGWIDMSFKCTTKSRSSSEATSEDYFSSSSEFENSIVENCFSANQSTQVSSNDANNIVNDSPIIRSNRMRSRNFYRIEDDTFSEESPKNPQTFLKTENLVDNTFFIDSLTESFSFNDVFNDYNHMSPCILSQPKNHHPNNFEKENLDVTDCLQSSSIVIDAKSSLSCSPLSAHCCVTPLRDINNIVRPTPQKLFKFKSLKQRLT
nr:unnamed protein product [Hydra vulgaris]